MYLPDFLKNVCRSANFPTIGKKQKLILISKPGKTLGQSQLYSLLVTLGKCSERFIYYRLQNADGLSEYQQSMQLTW